MQERIEATAYYVRRGREKGLKREDKRKGLLVVRQCSILVET